MADPRTPPVEPSSGSRPRPSEQDPRLWRADGWTARVIKNEDDETALSLALSAGHKDIAALLTRAKR